MSDRAPCCCMMLCVRADGVETAGHRATGPVTDRFCGELTLARASRGRGGSMQQAAFKVCRVACREVCPPGEIGVYPDCYRLGFEPPLHYRKAISALR